MTVKNYSDGSCHLYWTLKACYCVLSISNYDIVFNTGLLESGLI